MKCKCEFMPGVKGKTKIEGYDPESIKKQWRTAREIRTELDLDEWGLKELLNTLGIESLENISAESIIDGFVEATAALDEGVKPTVKNIAEAMKANVGDMQEMSMNLIHRGDNLYEYMSKVKPEDGFSDYALHSDGIIFDRYGADQKDSVLITVKDLADIIRSDPSYDGGSVRLLACSAGKYENGAASILAKMLGVKVKAPSDKLYVNHAGEIVIAENESLATLAFQGIIESKDWVIFE